MLDSGAWHHVAGDPSLFPKELITNPNPGYHIKVASGARYPVAYVGSIALSGLDTHGNTVQL